MSEIDICEKCGGRMEYFVEGSTCGTTCKDCGWGWVTTYQDPIMLDNADYALCIEPITNPSVDNLRCIASLFGCNFLEAKRMLQNKILLTQKATTILTISSKLKSNNIIFTITPEFPYEIK